MPRWEPKGPLSFLRGAKITFHKDARCGRVANMLNGWEDSKQGKQWLVELFRSDAEIYRETRTAIADALERDTGLRLELVKPDGRPTAGIRQLKLQAEYQEIADDVLARIEAGEIEKNAKADVARDRGISARKVADALRYRRGAIAGINITRRPAT